MTDQNMDDLGLLIAAAGSGYGDDVPGYKMRFQQLLDNPDPLEQELKKFHTKLTLDLYLAGLQFNKLLNCCWNYAYRIERHEEVNRIKRPLEDKLFKFACSYKKAEGRTKALVDYVCWTKFFQQTNWQKILEDLLSEDLLYKNGDQLCVIGAHKAVGDNTFHYRGGRQYRDYIQTFSLQAFPVTSAAKDFSLTNEPPSLPPYFEMVYFGDYKYHARPVSLRTSELMVIQENYLLAK